MGKLLIGEIQGDALDGLAREQFLVSDLQPIIPEPFAQGDAVRLLKMPLNRARANAAHRRKLARLEFGSHSQRSPIEWRALVEGAREPQRGRMSGRDHDRVCWVARSVRVARNG